MEQSTHSYGFQSFAYTDADGERILHGLTGDSTFLTTPGTAELIRKSENESKRLTSLQLHLITLRRSLHWKLIFLRWTHN
ncbi:hypothetical protein GDO81_002454 [Engystomops pustulosus]|uniref:MHC class I antigen n=1 Tax=Engystomops pustulosus TaxID=76066 RepID=A0AAV7DN21_ENGPU|nr:hypothetical protein GDO81_002454 [Engystomops pustulosus]